MYRRRRLLISMDWQGMQAPDLPQAQQNDIVRSAICYFAILTKH